MSEPALPDSSEPVKRKRGGQPGNRNGLKHGLYIQGNSVRNLTPVERAWLFDLTSIIAEYKQFMHATYEGGQKCRTVAEFNDTMRALAIAGAGLSRLLTIMNSFHITSIPSDVPLNGKTTVLNLAERFSRKITALDELADLDPQNAEE